MTLRVGLIGCGTWGTHYARILGELPETELTLVCDLEPSRLPLAPLATCDWSEAAAHPAIDAVIVATPAVSHFEIARAALLAGKHVLVEKPQTTALRDSLALLRLADDAGNVLMTGHTFLFHDGIERLRTLLPAIGRLRRVEARRTHYGPVRHDVGVVWDLAAHDLAILHSLLGTSPEAVSARASADEANIRLRYSDAEAEVNVGWLDPVRRRDLALTGDLGEMRFHAEGANARVEMPDGDEIAIEGVEPLRAQTQHFVDCVLRGETCRSNGLGGARVVRVLEAIDDSLRSDGAWVAVRRLQP